MAGGIGKTSVTAKIAERSDEGATDAVSRSDTDRDGGHRFAVLAALPIKAEI